MATSFVHFRGRGFWVSDALLEIWLYCLAAEVRKLPRVPAWLSQAAENWEIQAQRIATGAIDAGLDETLTSSSRIDLTLALCHAADQTLQSGCDSLRHENLQGFPRNPGKVSAAEMRRLAAQFAWLLKGKVTSTASSREALPEAWNADPHLAVLPFADADPASSLAALALNSETAPASIPGSSTLPQPEKVFTFQEHRVYMREGNQAWWRAVAANQNYPSAGTAIVFGNVKHRLIELMDEYPSHLPVYLLARCPICGGQVSEAVDTFSLNGFGWNNKRMEPSGRGWLGASHLSDQIFHPAITYQSECEHIQLMFYGVNLNGQEQFENLGWSAVFIGAERPYIIPPLLDLPDTFAVLHGLPLGNLADTNWTPRYTIYFCTYFSAQPAAFQQAIEPYRTPKKNHIPRISPYDSADYNLLPWAQRGKLSWLNPADPQLSLDSTPKNFPYANIVGREGRWVLQRNNRNIYDLRKLGLFQDGWFGY